MSIFNNPDIYEGDGPFDDQMDESGDGQFEDDDVLNDETFGAAEVVDWESEHARLAGLDVNGFEEFGDELTSEGSSGRQQNGKGGSNVNDRHGGLPEASGHRSHATEDSDFGVDVEMNLQRLVLEVDRDDRIESAWLSADPAIKMLSKKIPKSQSNDSAGSGGNTNAAVPGGRVMGTDILESSHAYEPSNPANASPSARLLAGMEDKLDTIWGPSPSVPPQTRPPGIVPPSLPGIKTVSELEDELAEEVQLQQRQHQQRQQQQHQQQFMSQQALPKAVLDGSLSPTPQQMLLQQQQQQLAAALFQQQQQQSAHPHTRPMLPTAFQHPMFLGRGRGMNPAASLLSPVGPVPGSSPLAQSVSQMLLQPPNSALGLPLTSAPQQMEMLQHLQQMFMQQQQQQQQQQQASLLRSHLEAINEQIQHQQLLQQQQQHPPHSQHQQMPQPHAHHHMGYANDRRWHNSVDGAAANDSSGYQRQRRYSDHIGPDRVGNSDDPFAGLMTRSEKEWLISIHHRQLEVDNPFVQDYYYTQYRLKKDLAARGAAIAAGQLPLPPDPLLLLRAPVEVPDEFDDSVTPAHTSAPYEPSQFANTLGKLTTASVHNPRQVIDARVHRDSAEPDEAAMLAANGDGRVGTSDEVSRKASTGGNSSGGGGSQSTAMSAAASQERYRRVLLTIENCYSLLLRIQEYDLSIAKILVPNAPSRHVLITDRHRLKQQLVDTVLASESSLVDIFRVRKGALLFARMLNKLEVKYVDLCMRSLFKCFPRIRQSPKSLEVLEEVGSDLLKIISASLCNQEGTMMLRNLLFFIWMNTNHAEILSHSLGLSLVLEILNQFASSVKDQEELKQLQIHAEQMAMNLFVLPADRRVRPFSSYFKLLNFMKRHLPEAMRNNFSDQLAFCMTTGLEEDGLKATDRSQGDVKDNEESKVRPPLHEVGPAGGHRNPILTSASSA